MPKKGIHIGPRELFLILQSLTANKQILRSQGENAEANEVDDLWLKLEEHWDALSASERRRGAQG